MNEFEALRNSYGQEYYEVFSTYLNSYNYLRTQKEYP